MADRTTTKHERTTLIREHFRQGLDGEHVELEQPNIVSITVWYDAHIATITVNDELGVDDLRALAEAATAAADELEALNAGGNSDDQMATG